MTSKPTIAFFGATGGCALNTLVLTLKNGYPCVAFARTPAKLTKMLTEAPHSVEQATIDAQLKIVAGDIFNADSIKPVFANNPAIIISGIGATPKFTGNPLHPFTSDQPQICEQATDNIVGALRQLETEGKLTSRPFFVAIGTTGTRAAHSRDLPLVMQPLYRYLGADLHDDKEVMEERVIKATQETSPVLAGFTIVRPSLLLDGESKGLQAVRVGWERHPNAAEGPAGPGPAIGYAIRRIDVGRWMYENLIQQGPSEWNRRCVSLTY